MERRNIILIAAILLLAAGIFIVKKYMGGGNDCPKIIYTVSAKSILAGESIHYEDNTPEANEWKWDFGDGNFSDAQNGDFTYKNPGDYIIQLTINGKCTEKISIHVGELVISSDTTQKAVTITGPSSCKVGEAVKFSNATDGATKWEWQFGESGNTDSYDQNPTYTYAKPGSYTIVLRVDASKAEGRFKITVAPKANGGGGTAAAPAPRLSDTELKAKLLNITKGHFEDEYYAMLKKYFCDNDHVPVIINGSQNKSIYSYCMQLDIQRNTQINDVKVEYDEATKCISKITVNQK